MTNYNWQPLIEGMIEAVWLVDTIELRIVAANRAAEAMLGAKRGGFIGHPVINLSATPEDIFFWEDVAAGLSDQIFSETLLRRQDEATVQVERRVSLIKLDQAASIYVVAAHDMSTQRRAEDQLEKLIAELRATLESTADGILVTDMEGAIRSCNQRFSEMWDLPTRPADPAQRCCHSRLDVSMRPRFRTLCPAPRRHSSCTFTGIDRRNVPS